MLSVGDEPDANASAKETAAHLGRHGIECAPLSVAEQDGIRTTLLAQAEALVSYSTMVTVEPPAMIGTLTSVGSQAKTISPLPPKRIVRATAPT